MSDQPRSGDSVRPTVAFEDTGEDPTDAVHRVMDAAGFPEEIGSDETVFVKPNYTRPEPRPGVTTSRAVLEPVLDYLTDKADRVLVGEADGGYASFRAEASLEGHNMPEMCASTGAEAVNLSARPPVSVERRILGEPVEVRVSPVMIDEVDLTVSVPVVKTHAIADVSLGIKNLFGCDADGMRLLRRKHLGRRLALLAEVCNARLTVVDGITALDGYGPIKGDTVDLGKVAAGSNLVATDATVARAMGFDPSDVDQIETAHRAGLGPRDPDEIQTKADSSFPLHDFHVERGIRDYLVMATFESRWLAKLVYDSAATPFIFGLFGRQPNRGPPRKYDDTS